MSRVGKTKSKAEQEVRIVKKKKKSPLEDIDIDAFEFPADQISASSDFLKQPIDALLKNFGDMDSLLHFPITAARELTSQEIQFHIALTALLRDQNWRDVLSSKGSSKKYLETERKIAEEYMNKHSVNDIAERVDAYQARLLRDDAFARAVETLSVSLTVLLWTTYECFTKDVWICAVNTFPRELGLEAFKNTQKQRNGDISPKLIPVRLLADYDFDLKNVLGNVLSTRYEFTRIQGIQRAFKSAFGSKINFGKIISKKEIKQLEMVRHLLVHRAGIVDEKFCKQFKNKVRIGQQYRPDDKLISQAAKAVKSSCIKLIQSINEWSLQISKPAKLVRQKRLKPRRDIC